MISQSNHLSITLTATNDFGSIHRYELDADQGVFIGASDNCGLQLHGAELADIHCRIGIEEGKAWVQDWMSSTGTRVNGNAIDSKVEVHVGDVIEIGQHKIAVGGRTARSDSDPCIAHDQERSTAAACTQETESLQNDEFATDFDDDSDETILDGRFLHNEVMPKALEADLLETFTSEQSSDLQVPAAIDEADAYGDSSTPRLSTEDAAVQEAADDVDDFDEDFFDFEEEESFDKETVALLQAEIEDLQAALAQRDAERFDVVGDAQPSGNVRGVEESDEVLQRMQDLVEEANRSDERVSILEEMLHAAEDANRREHEERQQLEAWVNDIEERIGQREEEHAAEVESLKLRIEDADAQQEQLQRKFRKAAVSAGISKEMDESMEELQQQNRHLQFDLDHSRKECVALQQQLDKATQDQEALLREERAKLAKEQAQASRLRYELSTKLAAIEEMPKNDNVADREASEKIRTLREHLREIHEQEKQEEKEASLATRLSKLWKRVEY